MNLKRDATFLLQPKNIKSHKRIDGIDVLFPDIWDVPNPKLQPPGANFQEDPEIVYWAYQQDEPLGRLKSSDVCV